MTHLKLIILPCLLLLNACVGTNSGNDEATLAATSRLSALRAECFKQNGGLAGLATVPASNTLEATNCLIQAKNQTVIPVMVSQGVDVSPILAYHQRMQALAIQYEQGKTSKDEYSSLLMTAEEDANTQMAMQQNSIERQQRAAFAQSLITAGQQMQNSRPVFTNCNTVGSSTSCMSR